MSSAIEQQLQQLIAHLDHVLPAQAPLQDFVHHNTLHGLQHLPFNEAIKQSQQITGNTGYLPIKRFRQYYQQGRINDQDLSAVLSKTAEAQADDTVFSRGQHNIRKADIYQIVLLHEFKNLSACQLNWEIEENNALTQLQQDISPQSRQRLLQCPQSSEQAVVEALWAACLQVLNIDHAVFHPEELQDLNSEHAERLLDILDPDAQQHSVQVEQLLADKIQTIADALFTRLGKELTIAALIQQLTDEDARQDYHPLLIRYASSWLDQGIASWQPLNPEQGFYRTWKQNAQQDLLGALEDMPDWYEQIESLPDDATATIVALLTRMGIPKDQWMAYLQQSALDLAGWSGMFLWRHKHPNYQGHSRPVNMLDYLAVKLALEYLFVQRICRHRWLINASLFDLKTWFVNNKAQFFVRYHLYQQQLPEYLIAQSQYLLAHTTPLKTHRNGWLALAHRLWTWLHSPAADRPQGYSVSRAGWVLFRLMQHLGVCANTVKQLQAEQIQTLFACVDWLRQDEHKAGFIWLQAYERHYHHTIFNALASNQSYQAQYNFKGDKPIRPEAQLVFCMDDREEGIRRHLEEINPKIETLGAAAFFNLVINWQGLDDEKPTNLCPVVATPEHLLDESPKAGQEKHHHQHQQRRQQRLNWYHVIQQGTRRDLFSNALTMVLSFPMLLMVTLGKLLSPLGFNRWLNQLKQSFELNVETDMHITACEEKPDRDAAHNQHGFTDVEQADRIEAFLRNLGLIDNYAPLVVMVGHGSDSVNNPHKAAYNCGACSGRNSGPNARAFAAMANRPQVRALLKQRGLAIPDDCWFLGAMHNTADEDLVWEDTDKIPQALQANFAQLQQQVHHASEYSAHERCRRFASAKDNLDLKQAYDHVVERTYDLSQVRPELGHLTNAVAFIGRRACSRGVFWDRRAFLISYDYTTDPEGKLLEGILLSAGPVGAGINLEYYFSAVDNEHYGSGPKTLHNLTGLLGVMEGASSDLRTGLPFQMIDIHEAMRLQVIVEADVNVVTAIYQRQPPLQELIGNGWILVSVKDPKTQQILEFDPAQGFVPWQGQQEPLHEVARSGDWYQGKRDYLSPARVKSPIEAVV